jgi:hypothetical protein
MRTWDVLPLVSQPTLCTAPGRLVKPKNKSQLIHRNMPFYVPNLDQSCPKHGPHYPQPYTLAADLPGLGSLFPTPRNFA